jgi:hypothetical protein
MPNAETSAVKSDQFRQVCLGRVVVKGLSASTPSLYVTAAVACVRQSPHDWVTRSLCRMPVSGIGDKNWDEAAPQESPGFYLTTRTERKDGPTTARNSARAADPDKKFGAAPEGAAPMLSR